jgi:hypothetical protein
MAREIAWLARQLRFPVVAGMVVVLVVVVQARWP